jgi:hypothetical protein
VKWERQKLDYIEKTGGKEIGTVNVDNLVRIFAITKGRK